jgi:predicted metal-dependent TIM-barrel fold hydrolase
MAIEHDLPVLVHTPHRDKVTGTQRTMDLLRECGLPPERAVIDHNNELTVPLLAGTGVWIAFSVYPDTKMDEDRMVRILQEYGTERMLVNSAADWGRSDVLKTAKTGAAMRAAGFSDDDVDRVLWRNPVEFFGQSGRLELDPVEPDASALHEGNSILRGQRPER